MDGLAPSVSGSNPVVDTLTVNGNVNVGGKIIGGGLDGECGMIHHLGGGYYNAIKIKGKSTSYIPCFLFGYDSSMFALLCENANGTIKSTTLAGGENFVSVAAEGANNIVIKFVNTWWDVCIISPVFAKLEFEKTNIS